MSSDSQDEALISEIRKLEKAILASIENANSIAALIKYLRVRHGLFCATSRSILERYLVSRIVFWRK